jgi:uncharacterized protein
MISLDGMGAAHDRQRAFANGRGSFDHVARGIARALEMGLSPDLSITVTGQTAASLPTVVAYALDNDLRFNLNFYRENDSSHGRAELVAEHAQIVDGTRAALAVIGTRLPQRRLIDGLIDRSAFDQPHEYACGAGHTYLAINQRGGVTRCQMEIEQPLTTVAADDPLSMIRLEPTGFRNLPADEKEGCRECSWRYWCAGGCPMLTFRTTGRSDVKSPYCAVYKALYPDVLRLEGLRLLKWASIANGQTPTVWVPSI